MARFGAEGSRAAAFVRPGFGSAHLGATDQLRELDRVRVESGSTRWLARGGDARFSKSVCRGILAR